VESKLNQFTERGFIMTRQTSVQATKSTMLRRTLQVNGLSTALMGLMMAAGARPLASFMGLDAWLALAIIGVLLLGHGIILFIGANSERVDPRLAWYAISGDVAWLAGSAVILLTEVLPLTAAGWWTVAVVADVVAVFAILQFIGLRRQEAGFPVKRQMTTG
jgi:uncharacterized membrane protein HdeD (DUF308 family)